MHYINVWLTVHDEQHVEQIGKLLAEIGRMSRQEPGCVRFEVYHSKNDRRRYLLCEHWESPEAHAVHREAAAFTQIYQPQVLPLVDRDPHPSDLLD